MTPREEITQRLADILEECGFVDSDEITPEKTFAEDLGIDSLGMVEFVVACEQVFELRIPDDECTAFPTVGDLVDYIAKAHTDQ